MIVAENLSKAFGAHRAVDDVSFRVEPGKVTGFLGPNGAGKSTTMRMIVGLDNPTSGSVTVNGQRYEDLRSPLTTVGIMLDAKAVHKGRSARNHLRALAATHGIPDKRVDEVIAIAGLEKVAKKLAGNFSLGMGQRLGIAAALLGDPSVLILDEPVNGLDPEGVRWVREFVRRMASEGRTVLLSSHLMSEMSVTADHLIVLGKGKVLADAPISDIIGGATRERVSLRTATPAQATALSTAMAAPNVTVSAESADTLTVDGLPAERIAELAAQSGVMLYQLTTMTGSLEEAYLALTGDSVEYHSREIA